MREAINRNREGAAALRRNVDEGLDAFSIGVVLGCLESAGLNGVTVQIVRTTETVLTLKRGEEEMSWRGASLAECIAKLAGPRSDSP